MNTITTSLNETLMHRGHPRTRSLAGDIEVGGGGEVAYITREWGYPSQLD
jgi:hypothetical protein